LVEVLDVLVAYSLLLINPLYDITPINIKMLEMGKNKKGDSFSISFYVYI
jgi:hypothetical protein